MPHRVYPSQWEAERQIAASVCPLIYQMEDAICAPSPVSVSHSNVYHGYPIKVTRRCREGLIAALPNLTLHANALVYRKMLEYLLYATLEDEDGGLVFPAETLAEMAGKKVGENGFSAMAYLEAFSRDIFPLAIRPHDTLRSKARTVTYVMPEALLEIGSTEALSASDSDLLWFVSGLPVTKTARRSAAERYNERIHAYLHDGVDQGHPARELITYLNAQKQITLGKRVRANWDRLVDMYVALEPGEHKNSVGCILCTLKDWCHNLYSTSERTVRISTRGITIHCLPRAFRKAALAGAIEMDIRSSQLAIVARLWNLSELSEYLVSKTPIWNVLLTHIGCGEDDADVKAVLKSALYSTCFGMSKRNLVKNLAKEIGVKKAVQFFRHPLLRAVLRGRSRALRTVIKEGGIKDAFGKWIPLSRTFPAHALLAQAAQSWELRLMLPVFDTVKDMPNVSILSWLHDGIVLWHSDTREKYQQNLCRVTKAAFDENAARLGFKTELEQMLL